MNEQWSPDGAAVKIFGDYSPHPVIVLKEVVEHFGSTEVTFHAIHRLRKAGMLPRFGASEAWPFSMRDIELAEENVERGERYWRWGTLPGYHGMRVSISESNAAHGLSVTSKPNAG